MDKLKQNEYVAEAMSYITEGEQELLKNQALFDKYSEQVSAIDPQLGVWLEEGFKMHMFYTNMSIDQNKDFLNDFYHAHKTRVEAGKKAAETRKANNLAAA